jgi:hypothetical protein
MVSSTGMISEAGAPLESISNGDGEIAGQGEFLFGGEVFELRPTVFRGSRQPAARWILGDRGRNFPGKAEARLACADADHGDDGRRHDPVG